MTETNKRILELIRNDKSSKEIANELGISEKQLWIRLKQIISGGYQIQSRYYSDSSIKYSIKRNLDEEINTGTRLCVPSGSKELRVIAISDTHIGNKGSDIDLIKRVYEYAAKNDINIIFNCGDLIEGDYTTDRKSIENVEDQVSYLIKNYPYDKNILNFAIVGNHDLHSLYCSGFNVIKRINTGRQDIIPTGYVIGNINIKGDLIVLKHELESVSLPEIRNEANIVLVGHGHMMKTKLYEKLFVCIPSLSHVSPDKTRENVPGFVDIKFSFDKKRIDYLELKHLILTPKVLEVSESRCKVKQLFRDQERPTNNRS